MSGNKSILLAISLWAGIMACPAYSQEAYVNSSYPQHHFTDMTIAVSPNLLFNSPEGPRIGGGINFQIFLFRYLSLESDLVFARNYVHLGPGTIALPLWMLMLQLPGFWDLPFSFDQSGLELMLFMILFTVISAEHMAIHIPLKSNTTLSPYFSLLRFRYPVRYNELNDVKYHLNFASGIKLNKYFGRFILSPYLEYNFGYTDHIHGINTGLYLGIYMPDKLK